METQKYDVVVLGAGTAGAAAAYQFARRGRRTALVDAKPFAASGARWVNGVAPWMFEAADIAPPEAPELRAAGGRTAMYSRDFRRLQTIAPNPMWSCDMRHLVQRLHQLAADAGVTPLPRRRVVAVECDGARPRAITLDGERGLRLKADLFVDAAGWRGGLRPHVPALRAITPEVVDDDLCVAVQRVHRIADVSGLQRFLDRCGAEPHDTLTLAGLDGGFSTVVLGFDLEAGEVDVLAGNIADGRRRNPLRMVDDLLAGERWLGEVVFGGGGLIPLRRPYDRFALPGIALIGNAACQVFPAHGSGIGAGMIAARQLAETTTAHADLGSAAALWDYQRTFMRSLGAVHAAYDVFRRMSQSLTTEEAQELLGSGMLVESGSRAAIEHRMPDLAIADLLQIGRAALRRPAIAWRFAPAVARMRLVHAHYRRYPDDFEATRFERWAHHAAGLFATRPDHELVPSS